MLHMCYISTMSTAPTIQHRTVVLLRDPERRRLASLARKEGVSAGEIMRRSLQSYTPEIKSAAEEDLLKAAVAQMSAALDEALQALRTARVEVDQTRSEIAKGKVA